MKGKEKNIVLESTSHATKDAKLLMDGKNISHDITAFSIEADARQGIITAHLKLVPEKVHVETKALA